MHAYIVVSLMAGVRPEEVRAIGWEQDVHLDGDPPSIAVLRADRAEGDTKTPKSRRALKLAQMAAGALREWQADQAAEREAAGSRWQDTGLVFTTAIGTPARRRTQGTGVPVACGNQTQREPHQAGSSLMYPASAAGRLRCRETRVRFPGHSGAGFSETFAQAEPFDVE
jgi:hypothetical protein